ncbi:hypothetical protein [Bradyrhizobium cenepequi]
MGGVVGVGGDVEEAAARARARDARIARITLLGEIGGEIEMDAGRTRCEESAAVGKSVGEGPGDGIVMGLKSVQVT